MLDKDCTTLPDGDCVSDKPCMHGDPTVSRLVRVPTHRPPTTPGEMFREEFMQPLGLMEKEVAKRLHISRNSFTKFIKGEPLDAKLALRLARYTGTNVDLWLNIQRAVDLYKAEKKLGAGWRGTITPLPNPAEPTNG